MRAPAARSLGALVASAPATRRPVWVGVVKVGSRSSPARAGGSARASRCGSRPKAPTSASSPAASTTSTTACRWRRSCPASKRSAHASSPSGATSPTLTQSREAIIDEVEAELGPVSIMVSNAALSGFRPFLDWDDKTLRRMTEVNVWAPWQLARRVLPGMFARGAGWILNVSSGASERIVGPPYENRGGSVVTQGAAYGSTKAMLNRWTQSLAAEVYGRGHRGEHARPARRRHHGDDRGDRVPDRRGAVRAHRHHGRGRARPVHVRSPTTSPAVSRTACRCSAELDRPVYDLSGVDLVDGWQPADLPARIAHSGIVR